MSDKDLPPGFEGDFRIEDDNGRLLIIHGAYLDEAFESQQAAATEAWRIYRSIELEVLRDLVRRDEADANPNKTTWEILHERIAELERTAHD